MTLPPPPGFPDDDAHRAAARLRQAWGARAPHTAVLLGSGWAGLVGRLQAPQAVDYADLPGFVPPTVAGHAGRVVVGQLPGAPATQPPVVVLCGRSHAYEHGDAAAMKGAIRALAAAGLRTLVQTNAAGSLHPAMGPGQVMLVADHLNLVQRTPLWGERGDHRFVDLADAYDAGLRAQAQAAVQAGGGGPLHEGVYAWMMGPQFETPAEIRMLQRLGADAVGMSTVPETILARHAGLRVLALSLITNLGCGLDSGHLSHAQTLRTAADASERAVDLLVAVLTALHRRQDTA
ncbi:purine-nucleoside phosphorylase [Ideonella sp.]|uniref:purine-nucleoside phosphorylase n=1 Tax=Ideonella sp. TaxID=1929293 RepID=UPI0035B1D6C2